MALSAGRLRGSIDVPDGLAPLRSGALSVEGWAFGAASPVSFVDVWLDQHAVGRAGLGRPRPDVAAALGDENAELSGFELRRDLAGRGPLPDRAVLRASVGLLDGTRAELPSVEIRLDREPVPSSPLVPLGVPLSPWPWGGPLRVLWFERALGRGGSQLRLRELLAYLARTTRTMSTVMVPSEGPLRRDLEATGAVVEVCGRWPVHDAVAYEQRMGELGALVAGRFDLIVGHTLTSFPAIDLAGRLGLPSVWRIGEAESLSTVVGWLQGSLDRTVEARARGAFTTASAVVFNSNAALRMQQAAGTVGRLRVLKTGVDVTGARAYAAHTDREALRRGLGVPRDRRLLICIGSLWPIKGQALLVRALCGVRAAQPSLMCALAGQPVEPYAGALARLVANTGLEDCVRILGFVDDVRPWLRAADAAVCASETESMPASVLEAMAFGLPVLATRVGDLPELVEPGRTGWLCEPKHLGSLIAGVEQLAITSSDDLRALGSAAARKVAAAHDQELALAEMAELIMSVARGYPGHAREAAVGA